jgi:CubicO group peptidase (beta-lactamase class C family)
MARLNPHAVDRIRTVLQGHIDRGRIPGAVALVSVGGETAFFAALGRQDPDSDAPMQADSIFRIYSMTKPIVSLAALMLVEQGRLQLGDPVSQWLPEFAGQPVAVEVAGASRLVPAQREPTVHDLLRHTAGFTYEFLGDSAVQQQYGEVNIASRKRSNAEFCKVLAAVPLAHQPGSCWHYSRATDVLAVVLEAVTGESLGVLLQESILGPLGMKDTAFFVPPSHHSRLAQPFATDPDTGEPPLLIDGRVEPTLESGGGGLMSTAGDYARFLQLMRNQGSLDGVRLLSRKTIAWMTADHLGAIPVDGDLLLPGYGFGLGVAVRTHAGLAPQPGSVGQYFWSGIGGTSFFVDPAEDLFALLLTQAPGQRIFFRNLFRQLVYGALD